MTIPTLDERLRAILEVVRDAGAQDDNFGGEDWTNSDRAIDNAITGLLTLITAEREAQDKHSRADEFLWFRRKLKEYMWRSTSLSYKAFMENFVEPQAAKYEAELQPQDKLKET